MIEAISVSDLTKQIKAIIDTKDSFQSVLVEGEISNYGRNSISGHAYFTLKDSKTVIRCVMFNGHASKLEFKPRDGQKVHILGKVTVYPGGGYYQIQAFAMKQAGAGDLYEQLEELKNKLDAEGLFDFEKKKTIPKYSETIGVITSRTGAVIRDIINVSTRRNPNIKIKLIPVSVQGSNSAPEIVNAIKEMNEIDDVDVIIVGRGGGSLEDLWSFNEESVVRAVYNSKKPIISAVGHETDTTLTDFASDLRAPTPSAAAEVAVFEVTTVKKQILDCMNKLDDSIKKRFELNRVKVENLKSRLKEPTQIINEKRLRIDRLFEIMSEKTNRLIDNKKNEVKREKLKLEAYSFNNTLKRGFAMVKTKEKYITDSSMLNKGDVVSLIFKGGKRTAELLD